MKQKLDTTIIINNDVFIDELEYNQEFYTMMLNDEKTAKKILGIFLKGLYSELKKA